MALRLRVISDHRHQLGEKSTFVFGVSGGSIGRSSENDWVLPDDMRYVSGRHARIVYHQGRYILQDTSSNGTYINDVERPLGSQNPHELRTGDILRIGEYHVQVLVDSANDFNLDDSALYATGSTSTRRRAPPPRDLGASLRLENLLEASGDNSGDALIPVNAFGQAVSTRTRALQSAAAQVEEPSTQMQIEADSDAVARRIARLARAAEKQQKEKAQSATPATAPAPSQSSAPAPSPAHDNLAGLQAFCRGAGIGPETLPVDAHARMLHLAGQLVRECLVGLKASNRHQQDQRNQLHVTYEKEPSDFLPSLDRHSVEELIQELLRAHDSRRFDAVHWLRAAFSGTRRHDDALARAMQAAFVDFIGRLDPRDLATRFERSARRKTMGNWELYGDFYRSLCETPAGTLPHIFVETFAQGYEAAAREGDEDTRNDAA